MQIITEIFSTIPGTTSAHAENTCAGEVFSLADENYLRVRGEYALYGLVCCRHVELPPRTRRIQRIHVDRTFPLGTTSAYAENTLLGRHRRRHRRNYLRVRGEYMSGFISPPPGQELPPRTRRIPRRCRRRPDRPGTTSAYAENTAASGLNPGRARNYLRVRGEYARP